MDAKDLLDRYRQDRQQLIRDLLLLNGTIRRIEADLDETTEESSELESFFEGKGESKKAVRSSEIRPDEFFGMSQGDAARVYLEKVGSAVPLDQLVEALKSGGCKVGGVNPKKTLYISLVRNTRDFVPVQNGYIGLRKFYPNLKAASTKPSMPKKQKRAQEKTKNAKVVKKVETTKRPKEQTAAPHKEESSIEKPTPKILREVLSDGHLRSLETLMKLVQEKAGKAVPKIVLLSVLRTKAFEQIGSEYKLRA